jgi:hypothetical protein
MQTKVQRISTGIYWQDCTVGNTKNLLTMPAVKVQTARAGRRAKRTYRLSTSEEFVR